MNLEELKKEDRFVNLVFQAYYHMRNAMDYLNEAQKIRNTDGIKNSISKTAIASRETNLEYDRAKYHYNANMPRQRNPRSLL